MTRIEVPSETLLVEMSEEGLKILETTMHMSGMDENAPVECDICSIATRSRIINCQSATPSTRSNLIMACVPSNEEV